MKGREAPGGLAGGPGAAEGGAARGAGVGRGLARGARVGRGLARGAGPGLLGLLGLLGSGCEPDYVLGGSLSSVSPGVGAPSCDVGDWPTTPGEHRRGLRHQQRERGYTMILPPGYDPCVLSPVLVVLRGEGAFFLSPAGSEASAGQSRARQGGYVVVYPEATAVGLRAEWNAPLAPPAVAEVDDVGFVAAILGEMRGRDPGRTYLAGFGEGETFGHTLAARLPVFAGFVGMAGTLGGRRGLSGTLEIPPSPEQPLSVLLIHGRADAIFPAEGGVVGGRFLLGKEAAETFWRKANGCSGDPVVTKLENSTTRYSACPGGREVSMLLLDGVGHQLPDDAAALRLQLVEVAFKFFERNAP